MLDFDYIIFCIVLIFLICILIITSIYIDLNSITHWLTNQDMENRQRSSCNNQDLDPENCDNSIVSSSPYSYLADFTHLGQNFPNSDLPPLYENCVLESKPPSYSSVIIYSQTSCELSAGSIQ